MHTARFVHDENIRRFQEKLRSETDPAEVSRLRNLIEKEEEIFRAVAAARREEVRPAPQQH